MGRSIQDQGAVSGCYGCGPDNTHGNQIKSFWEGDEVVAHYKAKPYQCAGSPDIVYGGLVASLIDCHSCNFAIARYYKEEKRAIGSSPKIYCVTGQLNVSFLKPTPIKEELELRARLKSVEGRKTWVECTLSAAGEVRAKADVLIIRLKEN